MDTKIVHGRKYMKSLCAMCKKYFYHRADHINVYCSRICAGKSRRKKPKTCFFCAGKFINKYHHNFAKFCSRACYAKARRKRIIVLCGICSKKIEIPPNALRKNNFCSMICASRYKIGDKSSQWKGGITPINSKIRHSRKYKLWREAVFKRDGYTCTWCKQKGGKLNADHIKQFAFYPKLRFKLINGRTLCKECHKKTDTYLVKAQIKYGKAS